MFPSCPHYVADRLFLDPLEKALVLCVDEKSQIQALDRSQPVLPMMPGVPERRGHDYIRAGTSTVFAAFEVATGKVIGSLHRRHRTTEFKKFPTYVDKDVPADTSSSTTTRPTRPWTSSGGCWRTCTSHHQCVVAEPSGACGTAGPEGQRPYGPALHPGVDSRRLRRGDARLWCPRCDHRRLTRRTGSQQGLRRRGGCHGSDLCEWQRARHWRWAPGTAERG